MIWFLWYDSLVMLGPLIAGVNKHVRFRFNINIISLLKKDF